MSDKLTSFAAIESSPPNEITLYLSWREIVRSSLKMPKLLPHDVEVRTFIRFSFRYMFRISRRILVNRMLITYLSWYRDRIWNDSNEVQLRLGVPILLLKWALI